MSHRRYRFLAVVFHEEAKLRVGVSGSDTSAQGKDNDVTIPRGCFAFVGKVGVYIRCCQW